MLKYHKNVEDHRFPHFQHHKKERKITMKKRCLSLLLTLCLLAALAVLIRPLRRQTRWAFLPSRRRQKCFRHWSPPRSIRPFF